MHIIYDNFKKGLWRQRVDVRSFIHNNYTPYEGDDSFLVGPTAKTNKVWGELLELIKQEGNKGGVLDIDVKTPSTIISHKAGYIDKDNEVIVGLQTDQALKRGVKPRGGVRLVQRACEAHGYTLDQSIVDMFNNHIKTHNDGVFGVYANWENFHTPEGVKLRKTGVITGLPDNYGRGRIIGDYRRVALYGIDSLIKDKIDDLNKKYNLMDDNDILIRDEVSGQIKALKDMKIMAESYGFDISLPATNFKEAVQWTYFAYLAAIKEQDGAAMSFGRIDAFFDVYAEKDLKEGVLTEDGVQEIIDGFVMKLRIARHLRPKEYDALFAGDPTWITCLLGGQGDDGRTLVTKTAYRIIYTLKNLGPAPEPNLTIAWTKTLPEHFKKFTSKMSIETCSLQFESDELMRPRFSDDYAIACCVSAAKMGKEMEFFGARCNLPKLLLMAINEGRDEHNGSVIRGGVSKLKNYDVLDYDEVKIIFFKSMRWLASRYVKTMNVIHYMHDKYNYENAQMALIDTDVKRYMAFGIAGISIVADSLSAIKHAKVTAIRNKKGVAVDFKIEGDFPKFGNDDDRVDDIAIDVTKEFISRLKEHRTYKNAKHTLSLLTITSNVIYGDHTGATPDGRKDREPFAPGANPMHGRDEHGALASLNSVAKIPYEYCLDGISNTFSIVPNSLGKDEISRIDNLSNLLDGYFAKWGHHLNVNVLDRSTLQDAMDHPEKYPQLTIRVSGYAVRFITLAKHQQQEVIDRTFHEGM